MGTISEGKELTVSYVDFLNLSKDRQQKLKDHFHFECTCEHCSQHIKDDLMMAAADSKVRQGTRGRPYCILQGDFFHFFVS